MKTKKPKSKYISQKRIKEAKRLGVTPEFLKIANEVMEEHKDALAELAKR